ncbi:uncharacterized protein LOC120825191 isoform X1 [Gasterosteus aculeatus]|uniref:uncharacterized protein LOC120825191 isoform X2 n=1 Tax=Gasterosteus aculeatus aculeatus TaxID=481459 RepID=UPI001A97D635|nr:uncharacterized protein LOC120825191 isoform X2 [Gasterosteus aculeatus aculeatus]
MKSHWITTMVLGVINMLAFWMPSVPAAEVRHVQYESNITLGCNISYLYHTTWLKHNPHLTPTVVLCASLRDGEATQGFRLSPRFSVVLMNRSLALRIIVVEERDLGLYYCVANVDSHFIVGRGTTLQVSSPGSSWFLFPHWYSVGVGFGLLLMVLAVCITHCKSKSNKAPGNTTTTAHRRQKANSRQRSRAFSLQEMLTCH